MTAPSHKTVDDFDNISDPYKYSELQTKLITLLELENHIIKLRMSVEEEMQELIIAPKSNVGEESK